MTAQVNPRLIITLFSSPFVEYRLCFPLGNTEEVDKQRVHLVLFGNLLFDIDGDTCMLTAKLVYCEWLCLLILSDTDYLIVYYYLDHSHSDE